MRWLGVILLMAAGARGDSRIPFSRLGVEGDIVWMRPLVAPALSFRVESGTFPENGPLMCLPSVTEHKHVDHADNLIRLECENGLVLTLEGVDFAH